MKNKNNRIKIRLVNKDKYLKCDLSLISEKI